MSGPALATRPGWQNRRALSVWREQALIEAPVERVWDLIGDPNRHPEWPLVVEVEGLPRIEQDATYRQVSLTPRGGTVETTFQIEKLDELREIKVRCTDYRTYAHWLITGAQDATFADLEIGFESNRAELGLLRAPLARRYLRAWAEAPLDGLRAAIDDRSTRDRSDASTHSPKA